MYKLLPIFLFAFLIADESIIYLNTERWNKPNILKDEDFLEQIDIASSQLDEKIGKLLNHEKFVVNIGFKIIDIQFNKVNGGSFSVTVAKPNFPRPETPDLDIFLAEENKKGLSTNKPYDDFRERIYEFKFNLRQLLDKLHEEKKLILGYGASTKGNVLLQFVGITSRDIPYIGEVNADKFGSYTPATLILIISEEEARKMNILQ